jgi:hypothetical protein
LHCYKLKERQKICLGSVRFRVQNPVLTNKEKKEEETKM